MANTYTYTGPGTRWTEGNPTAEDLMNIARINADHLHEALNTIMTTDDADGALSLPADATIADGFGLTIGATSQSNAGGVTPEFQVLGTGGADSQALLAMFNAGAGGPQLTFLKSGSATIGGSGIVGSADAVVQIGGYADDGTDYASAVGLIQISMDGTPGANDTPGKFTISLTPDGSQAVAEVFRITNAGHVNISGTTNESWDNDYIALQVGSNGSVMSTEAAGASSNTFLNNNAYWDGSNWKYQDTDEASQIWMTGGKFTVRLANSGTADTNITWSDFLDISSTGMVGINEDAGEGTIALNINQAGNDDEFFVAKSSDVAHGMTTYTEADTFFSLTKDNSATGGVIIWAYSEGNAGLILHARPGHIQTTDDSNALAAVTLKAQQWDGGTDVIACPATGNIMAVTDGTTTRFIVKGNGALHATNVTSGQLDGTALDGEDDIGLIRLFERTVHNDLGIIMSKWDEQLNVHEEDLRRVGVFKGDFYCLQRMDSLLGGGVWKNHCDIQDLRENVRNGHHDLKVELEQTRSELATAQAEIRRLAA